METLIGKKLLHYRIEKLIGEGGMGVVYYGVHEEIGRKAAIKVINPDLLTNPNIRERFLREARILAQLDHPNIVRLYEFIMHSNANDPWPPSLHRRGRGRAEGVDGPLLGLGWHKGAVF